MTISEQIFRVLYFHLLKPFEPSWLMSIKYAVGPSLLLVT